MIPLVFDLIIGKAAENRLQLITDLKADGLHDSVQCFLHRIAIGQLGGRFPRTVAAVHRVIVGQHAEEFQARFSCTAEEDSISEIAEITHAEADPFQDFGLVVAASNEAI